jgi:hypothetical protein
MTGAAAMDWFADPVPARARLFPGQAQGVPTCTVAIDAEEEFDWLRPLPGTQYSTGSMRNTEPLYDIFSAYGIVPAYLVTYPLLQDEDATRSLGRRAERGECVLGMQLHPWVTPPFDEPTAIASSFAGNLDPRIEEEKLLTLKHRFIENFGAPPRIFRAGRYGLGPATPLLLEQHGIEIDVSLAPRTSFAAEGGPDFSGYDCGLFWFGRTRRLLEIPLCRSLIGWGAGPLGLCALCPAGLCGLGQPAALGRTGNALAGGQRHRRDAPVTASPAGAWPDHLHAQFSQHLARHRPQSLCAHQGRIARFLRPALSDAR